MVDKNNVVTIDIHKLDEEWVSQPLIFMEYATKLADAKEAVARAKAEMELSEAELANSIRENPEQYQITKITEAGIVAVIKQDAAYKLTLRKYIRKRHEQDVLQATVDALEHRKKALENLVHLHGMSYFSEPKERAKAPLNTKRKG